MELRDNGLGELAEVIVSTWLSGYRFGTASVVAQASELGVQLVLCEAGDPR